MDGGPVGQRGETMYSGGNGKKGDSCPATDWAADWARPRAAIYFLPFPPKCQQLYPLLPSVSYISLTGGGVSKPPPPSVL